MLCVLEALEGVRCVSLCMRENVKVMIYAPEVLGVVLHMLEVAEDVRFVSFCA